MTTPESSTTPKKTPQAGKSDEEGSNAQSSAAKSATAKPSGETKDATELLKADHREVDQLFSQFESAKGRQQRKKLIEKIAAALTAHTMIEEEIFYPACRDKGVDHDDLDEAQVEHDTLKLLIADLLKSSQDDDYYEAKVTVLSEYVKHHVGEEEAPNDGLFARAQSAGLDLIELGQKLQARKDELMSDEKGLISRPPQIRSLNLSELTEEHGEMSRHPTDRYRDHDQENRFGGYRASGGEHRGSDYRGGRDYRGGGSDDEKRGSNLARGRSGEAHRGDHDEDFGSDRGAYGESGYSRSSSGYRDNDRNTAYRSSDSFYGGARGDHGGQDFGPSRTGNERGGRYLGDGGEDHEYYQGTRYGSAYGGGRYPTENDDDADHNPERDDRYYGGQGHGTTRDFGGRGGYGQSSGRGAQNGGHDNGRRDRDGRSVR